MTRAVVDRIGWLQQLHEEYNREQFSGRLVTPRLLIKRTNSPDGYYEYRADRHWKALRPPQKAAIVIGEHCFDEEGLVEGTLLHEMIHQYQVEVMKRKPSHDAVFNSIARKFERIYGVSVR